MLAGESSVSMVILTTNYTVAVISSILVPVMMCIARIDSYYAIHTLQVSPGRPGTRSRLTIKAHGKLRLSPSGCDIGRHEVSGIDMSPRLMHPQDTILQVHPSRATHEQYRWRRLQATGLSLKNSKCLLFGIPSVKLIVL